MTKMRVLCIFIILVESGRSQECNVNSCGCCKDMSCDLNMICQNGCIDGYYGDRCDNSCPDHCARCEQDSGTNLVCTSCTDGYTGSLCTNTCYSKCATCTQDDYKDCNTCRDGYYSGRYRDYSTYRYRYDCRYSCRSACTSCQSYNHCTSCDSGRFGTGDGNYCKGVCSNGCNVCNSETECIECRRGYYEDEGSCNECVDFCETCSTNSSCDECRQGYFKDGSGCSACSPHCEKCYNSSVCISCEVGYKVENGFCEIQCPDNCKTCISQYKCTDCNQGYDLESGVCNQMPCYDNTYFNVDECKTCPINCTTCTSGDDCTYCVNGYMGLICNETCSRCQQDTSCDKKSGYCYVSCADGLYGTMCNFNCDSKCRTCYRNNGVCIDCVDGYHGYDCRCSPNCYDCYTSGQCQSCKTGFENTTLNCKCRRDECANTECTVCKDRNFYAYNTACCECGTNIMNCQECSSTSTSDVTNCTKCLTGFYPNDSNTCVECGMTCQNQSCDSSTGKCIKGCKDGYWGIKCDSECWNHCLKCLQESGDCLECTDDRYSSDCTQFCPSNCKETSNGTSKCSNRGDCLLGCHGDFYGASCNMSCSANCFGENGNRCHDKNGTCVEGCLDGYYGNTCELMCDEDCVNNTCLQEDGICLCINDVQGPPCTKGQEKSTGGVSDAVIGGAVGGSIGFILIVVLVTVGLTIVLRNRHRQKKERSSNVDQTRSSYDGPAVIYSNASGSSEIVEKKDNDHLYEVPDNMAGENHKRNGGKSRFPKISSKKTSIYEKITLGRKGAMDKPKNNQTASQLSLNTRTEGQEENDLPKAMNNPPPDDATYYNTDAINTRRVTVNMLMEYVAAKTKEEFVSEFEDFPNGLIKPYVMSQTGENASKNRYKGIYPYDDNRVVLNEGGPDYINASYINGFNKTRAYIASMGPTIKYMKDMSPFWRLIWQENVGKIVMLTNLREAEIQKCDMYWPPLDDTNNYGEITVTHADEVVYAEHVVRTFVVAKNSVTRMVKQVHYTAWPDKGTPDDVSSLISFWQKVNSVSTEMDGPLLVHCSAGVGRTGTYIALDGLTEEGMKQHSVDVYNYVKNLRHQRVNMVQTLEQYQFLHHALVHTLTLDSKPIEADKFNEYMSSHPRAVLSRDLHKLTAIVNMKSEKKLENVEANKAFANKNRLGADLPGKASRPVLSIGRSPGSSDYINAVYVNSYKQEKRFIIAQTPLSSTVEDFIYLILQEKCCCVVDFDGEKNSYNDIGEYVPPDNQVFEFDDITTKVGKAETLSTHTQRILTIAYLTEVYSEDIDVSIIKFTGWNEGEKCPNNIPEFVAFVESINTIADSRPNSSVLVHCRNGAERSGLFCIVSILLEKVACDQQVSIINTVRQVKSRRQMAVPNEEQYLFCHKAVEEYLKTGNIYSNLS